MKPSTLLFATALALSPLPARSQEALQTEPQVVEKGGDFRVWEQLSTTSLLDGLTVTNRSSYTELCSGLHYLANGEFQLSDDSFELFNDNAVARRAAHHVILNANINSENAVDLLSPTGQRLVLRPKWLVFHNPLTQASSIIAEIKDAAGAVVERNVVVWEDCWTDFRGSIRATFRTTGFESDLLIHDNGFGTPEDYGMQSDHVRFELWHEATEAPAAHLRQQVLSDGAVDNTIHFGDLEIGPGKAFSIDGVGESVEVSKSWVNIDNRRFLIESVSYARLRPLLDRLGEQARVGPKPDRARQMAKVAPNRQALVARITKPSEPLKPRLLMASAKGTALTKRPAVVLDYTILSLGNDKTNWTFNGDETYYVSGTVNLRGTNTVFEGGAVIKMAPTNNARLNLATAVSWEASPFRPVVFSARDDHSQGEKIGNASLSGFYGETALYVDSVASGTNVTLQNLRICYATNALTINGGSGHSISHAQFVNCMTGIRGTNTQFTLRNALLHKVYTNFAGSMATGRCEQLTVNIASWLNFNSNLGLTLTNTLLGAVTNLGTIMASNYVAAFSDPAGVWQSVGSGYHYLSTNSVYRGAGTTNINQPLLAALRRSTTHPPIVLTTHFGGNTTLTPQAQRGSGSSSTIDLGWHYDPLDYCWTALFVSNAATLTLSAGTAIGTYGDTGFTTLSNATFVSEGAPTNLNRLVTYQIVQEQPVIWGSLRPSRLIDLPGPSSPPGNVPAVKLRFTDASVLGGSRFNRYLMDAHTGYMVNLTVRDSQLRGTFLAIDIYLFPGTPMAVAFTNNLIQRGYFSFSQGTASTDTPMSVYLWNNFLYGGTMSLSATSDGTKPTWLVRDNFFDTVSLTGSGTRLTNSHNGYRSTTVLANSAGSDVLVTNVAYQKGPISDYYYPNSGGVGTLGSLLNTGSRNATNAGLYHFTATIDLAKETNSVVDIGWHSVATTGSGSTTVAIDSDSDGIPDYAEDANGNGSVDSGETDWNNGDDWGLDIFITRPRRSQNIP